jgi:hypothetical protein
MKVRYLNYRINGEEMTGKVFEMDIAQARILIESNIVVPVEESGIETTSMEPAENTMLKLKKKRR